MITIVQSPEQISPAYNDLIYLVESNNYASAGFKFICVLKDGAGTTLAKLKAPILNGSTNQGVFNIQRIVESHTDYQFSLGLITFDETESTFEYEVEFGEEGAGVEHENLTSVTKWVWDAAMTRRNFGSFASGDWGITGTAPSDTQFLTTQRRRRRRNDQTDWLYFLTQPFPLAFWINYATYRSYDSNGSLLKTVTAFSGVGLGTIGNWYVGKVPSGSNLDDVVIGQVVSGTLPVIDPVAAYYTVQLYDNNDQPRTEEYRIDILDECSRFDSVNIFYLNPMGGFDSFVFDLLNRNFYDTVHLQMKQQRYELGDDTYGYNLNKHGLMNYDTVETQRVQLNSNWINNQESNAMHELIASPVVFMYYPGDDFYIPVTVTNTTWEEKQIGVDKLFNAQIEVKLDSERLQRG